MNRELLEHYDKLEMINGKLTKYSDEKGNIEIIPTAQLLVGVEYIEIPEDKYKIAKFNKVIDDLEYTKTEGLVIRPKNEITKKEEDKTTIIENEELVYQVWVLKNSLNMKKSFTTKEEAVKICNTINEKILNVLEV